MAADRLTRAQADEILKRSKAHGGAGPLFGPGPGFRGGPRPGGPPLGGPGRFGRGPLAGPIEGGLDAAAKYLGLTNAQLVAQLRAGKSLADVAGAQKKTTDGLEQAVQDAVESKLDAAVTAKHLTNDAEQRILSGLKQRIGEIVAHKGLGPRGGPGVGPRGGHRFGPRGGHRFGPRGGHRFGPPRFRGHP